MKIGRNSIAFSLPWRRWIGPRSVEDFFRQSTEEGHDARYDGCVCVGVCVCVCAEGGGWGLMEGNNFMCIVDMDANGGMNECVLVWKERRV